MSSTFATKWKRSNSAPKRDVRNLNHLNRMIQYLYWSLSAILLLTQYSVEIQGVKSFCIAPTVHLGEEAIISCHFDDDISRSMQDVIVYIYKDNDKTPVVQYSWFNGQPSILEENGYVCARTISEFLVVKIPNTKREHAALYSCIVAPSDKGEVTPCTLKIIDGNTNTSVVHNGNINKNGTGVLYTSSQLQYNDGPTSTIRQPVTEEKEESWQNYVMVVLSVLVGILLTALIVTIVLCLRKNNGLAKCWKSKSSNENNVQMELRTSVIGEKKPLYEEKTSIDFHIV